MLCFEDCVALSGLTEDEVHAIAEHEHLTGVAAAELGNYLLRSPEGELLIKRMIVEDIAEADRRGDRLRTLSLKLVLREFVLQHPRCDARCRALLGVPERRAVTPNA